MKLLLAVAAIIAVIRAEVTLDEGVLVLTDGNFNEVVEGNEFVLVEFCKYLPLRYVLLP